MMCDKKSCIIVGAAPCKTLAFLSENLKQDALVYAADGGYLTAMREGLRVDAFVGDLDSNSIKPTCDDCTVLPREKDFGDVHTAILKALSAGCNDFYLVGCSGGRADHYLANVSLLEMISNAGASGVLLDEHNEIRFIKNEKVHAPRAKKYLSLIALDEEISGVTLKGLKYPLDNATLRRDTPIGISNEWIEDVATISVENGRALLIFSEDDAI